MGNCNGAMELNDTDRELYHRYLQKLGLTPEANIEDVKKAYRRLVLKYHPDLNPRGSAIRRFREIVEAYGWIIEKLKYPPERKSLIDLIREDEKMKNLSADELWLRFKYSKKPEVRRIAIIALSLKNNDKSKMYLLQALGDYDKNIVYSVVNSLCELYTLSDLPMIIKSIPKIKFTKEKLDCLLASAKILVKNFKERIPSVFKRSRPERSFIY